MQKCLFLVTFFAGKIKYSLFKIGKKEKHHFKAYKIIFKKKFKSNKPFSKYLNSNLNIRKFLLNFTLSYICIEGVRA